MSDLKRFKPVLALIALMSLAALASCARMPGRTMSAQECMTRVMYFESNRSSQEGMIAVGTVVMNRLQSGRYPDTVCGVVGQKNQFAPGVLSKPMGKGRDLASKTATMVLRGKKHGRVGKAMFFHTAGYSFPYSNMHYVAIAGGNAFYEKRKDAHSSQAEITRRDTAPAAVSARRPQAPQRVPTFDPAWTGEADTFEPEARTSPAIVPPYETPAYAAPRPTAAEPRLIPEPTTQRRQDAAPVPLAPMSIEDLILQGRVMG